MKYVRAGVDLVNVSRVRRFLKTHSSPRILRLLSPKEQKRFSKKKISAVVFAKIFAAKEAFFKTLNASWMGLEGFASMETKFLPQDRFSISLIGGALAKKKIPEARGSFFQTGDLIGAQVIRWE